MHVIQLIRFLPLEMVMIKSMEHIQKVAWHHAQGGNVEKEIKYGVLSLAPMYKNDANICGISAILCLVPHLQLGVGR